MSLNTPACATLSHTALASLQPGCDLVRTGTVPGAQKAQGIKTHNPTILSFTFLTIKGKIGGPKNVRMELLDYGQEAPRTQSAQLVGASRCVNSKPEHRPVDPPKTERIWGGWDEGLSCPIWPVPYFLKRRVRFYFTHNGQTLHNLSLETTVLVYPR